MRIHGIHVQGLRAPSGHAQLALDPAWATLPAVDSARRGELGALLRALLFPDRAIGRYFDWVDPDSSAPARAGLSFGAEGDSFRLIVDFARERLVLGRLERETGRYARVSTVPSEIAAKFAALGLPPLPDYAALAWLAPDPRGPARSPRAQEPSGPVVAAAPAPLDSEAQAREIERAEGALAAAEAVERGRAELRVRIAARHTARERLLEAERDLKAAKQELSQLAPLAEGIEDVDERIGRYRALVESRDSERALVEAARAELQGDRARMRVVPNAQRAWTALGLVLGATGAAAGAVAHPGFTLLGLGGVGLAFASLASTRRARRGMGAIDARLAALRVRERAIERHFEAEGAPVRVLLRTLGLDDVDALASAVGRSRSLHEQVDVRTRALATAGRAFPEGAEGDLTELEARLAELPPPSDLDALRAHLATFETPPARRAPEPTPERPDIPPAFAETAGHDDALRAADVPERALRAAAAWLGRPQSEIAEALAPALPVYLRSLTRGAVIGAEPGPEGLLVYLKQASEPVAFAELPPDRRLQVGLALRLAILERLAARRPIPVIVRVDGLGLDAEGASTLSRALRRVSAVTQVVQLL